MKRNRIWILVTCGLVLTLGLVPSLEASVCDEDPPNIYPRKIQPVLTVGPLLDIMLTWFTSAVDVAFPEEMDVNLEMPPWDEDHPWRFNEYGHTMSMHLSEVEGVLTKDIMSITSELGKVKVRINFPAMTSHVDITGVSHDQPDCGGNLRCEIENGILDLADGMDMGMAILAAAGLGFVGVGAQPPAPEWGAMISVARNYLPNWWWYALFPGLAIFITVLGFNLLGDGLRDILDPQSRGYYRE